ncbi:energy-coupling factor transporter transmembrane component T family protein [Salsuginibacillus kocurii]|uniref:energy-coupling factor transporter transmembrane component T family protein n=1 Tax=Salsuginibacillus kocurii TaxID=427078 RepID=UPI00036FEB95|nr:energy-coupling factor transporter transmembrane component T [Salsuginibacillus kocurii]
MANVLVGQYVQGQSVFHTLDPRTKVMSIFSFMVAILFVDDVVGYVTAALIVAGAVVASRIPLRFFFKGLRPMLFFLLVLVMFHIVFSQGQQPLFTLGWFTVYVEGIKSGMEMLVRIVLLVVMASILTLTTKPLDLSFALAKLWQPLERLHLPVQQISLMVSLALRFIPTLLQEAEKIIEAQKARGATFADKNLFKRVYLYVPVLIPLIISSLQRAEQLTDAIDSRAYGTGAKRTTYRTLQYTRLDYMMLVLFAGFIVLLVGDSVLEAWFLRR